MARRARPAISAEQLEAREVPATAFALGSGINVNTLFRFDTLTPATLSTPIPVTGLGATFNLVGIDFRPATGELYGFAVSGANTQLYTIDLNGAATAVGPAVIVNGIATATKYGVDFNPVADRLRVVTDLPTDDVGMVLGPNVNNFRINPNNGTLVAIDADLDFAALPGEAPEVTVAYTNNDTSTATGTTLFGITIGANSFVTNGGADPAFNVLTGVGPLNVATGPNVGLDIFSPANSAVAILDTAAGSQLFTVNIGTGAATLVGLVGDGTIAFLDVSVAPAISPSLASGLGNGSVTPLVPTFFGTTAGQLTVGTAVTAITSSTANVRTATGDVNGDGVDDIIAVTGPGVPIRLTVISGVDNTTVLVAPFDPFGGDFTGGGYVSAADFDPATGAGSDGRAEFIVTPDQGGGPRVSIFTFTAVGTAPTLRANFFGIDDRNFRGGARSATGFVNADGIPELVVVAGFGGGPRTAVFNGTSVTSGTPTRLINDFIAFPGADATTLRNGVFVALSDINGDGIDEFVFGGGPGGAPRVFILSGALVSAGDVGGAQTAPVANFFVAGNSTDRGGVRVAFANLDGDGRGDLIVGSGEGRAASVRAYRGLNFTSVNEPTTFQDIALFGGGALPGGVFVG